MGRRGGAGRKAYDVLDNINNYYCKAVYTLST